jgi:hypothetical protein
MLKGDRQPEGRCFLLRQAFGGQVRRPGIIESTSRDRVERSAGFAHRWAVSWASHLSAEGLVKEEATPLRLSGVRDRRRARRSTSGDRSLARFVGTGHLT